MKTIFTNFNLRPINKTAGIVTSAGFEFKPIKEYKFILKDIPEILDSSIGFCGKSFGRFTVIGFHAVAKRGGRWVLRCSCGNYTICTGKRINESLSDPLIAERAMCDECDYLIFIRSGRKLTVPISKNNRSIKKAKNEIKP